LIRSVWPLSTFKKSLISLGMDICGVLGMYLFLN